MKISRILFLFFLAVITTLSGCASVKYGTDFKSGTDFNPVKTYSWRAATINIPGANQVYLQGLIDEQLQTQGYQKVESAADVLVDLQLLSRVSRGGNTSIGIGLGLPVGRHGSIGLGTGQTMGRGKQKGVLIIDITDASSNALIWRGNAEEIPLIYFSLQSEPKLREIIQKVLIQFPPK
jgi:hypothetical protein